MTLLAFDMPAFDATRVGSKLWVGSRPVFNLRGRGFNAVVLCAEEHQNVPTDVPVIRVPLDDAQITNIEFARAIRAAQKVSDLRRVGKRVLVTCAMGINRSAFVAALSLMQLNRLTAAQAVQHIRQIRGQQTVIPPLSNPSFVEALRRFEDAHR